MGSIRHYYATPFALRHISLHFKSRSDAERHEASVKRLAKTSYHWLGLKPPLSDPRNLKQTIEMTESIPPPSHKIADFPNKQASINQPDPQLQSTHHLTSQPQ